MTMIELHVVLSMAMGIYIIGQSAADLLRAMVMSGLHLIVGALVTWAIYTVGQLLL